MKKLIIVLLSVCIGMTGCIKRVAVESVEKERVDIDQASGNRGFIAGNPPPQEQGISGEAKKRKVYQLKIQMPPYANWKNFRFEPTEDKEIWGNRGYIYGGPNAVKQAPQVQEPESKEQESIVLPEEENAVPEQKMSETMSQPAPAPAVSFKLYEVKKGDTLQKISDKVYGTTKKWKKIYDYNSDVLKNPNKIYPGQKIKIPQE